MTTSSHRRILVLNRLWQAVNVVGVERAFSLLVQEHAQAILTADGSFRLLDSDAWIAHSLEHPPRADEEAIRTIRYALRIPSVLILRWYDRVPVKEIKFSRDNIFARDGHRCQYCGQVFPEDELNLDHVIPRDQGGKTSWENIVTSCLHCNSRKANRMPHQAHMRLLRRPLRPNWRPFSCLGEDEVDSADWRYFLHRNKTP